MDKQVRWSANSLFAGGFYFQDDGAPYHPVQNCQEVRSSATLEDNGLASSVSGLKPHRESTGTPKV